MLLIFYARIQPRDELVGTHPVGSGGIDVTAFAISADYISGELEANPRYPYKTYCNAADVNVRSEANTDCDIVTMLQNGDNFYYKLIPKFAIQVH